MSIYSDIRAHRGMIFDEVRNRAYQKAILKAIEPGSNVLDLGAGLGIHGLMAAAAGARRVVLLDSAPVVRLGAELAKHNVVEDRVEVIRGRAETIKFSEPFDVIVSVFTGNFLLTEDLLPVLFSARDRLLKPGGALIPGKARMMASLVEAKDFYLENVGCWSDPTLGIDFSPIRRFAGNGIYFGGVSQIGATELSETVLLQAYDFATADNASCHCKVEVPVIQSGVCHGILGWFDIQLGDDWLSTGPDAKPTHWSLAFLPLDPPMELKDGDTACVEIDRPEFGEWTWKVRVEDRSQRHSTFQYKLADLDFLRSQSGSFAPGLGPKGEGALFVLQKMREGKTIAEIVRAYKETFPELATNDLLNEVDVRKLANDWGREAG